MLISINKQRVNTITGDSVPNKTYLIITFK